MFLRRMALIGLLVILVMASCARRATMFKGDFDFDSDFESNIRGSLFEEFDFGDEVTVIERIGDNVISTQTVTFDDVDELNMDDFDFDADTVSFDLSDGKLQFELTGDGDVQSISADFNSDRNVLEIVRTESGR